LDRDNQHVGGLGRLREVDTADAVLLSELRGPLGVPLHEDQLVRLVAAAEQTGQQRLTDLACTDDRDDGIAHVHTLEAHARHARKASGCARSATRPGRRNRAHGPGVRASWRAWQTSCPLASSTVASESNQLPPTALLST